MAGMNLILRRVLFKHLLEAFMQSLIGDLCLDRATDIDLFDRVILIHRHLGLDVFVVGQFLGSAGGDQQLVVHHLGDQTRIIDLDELVERDLAHLGRQPPQLLDHLGAMDVNAVDAGNDRIGRRRRLIEQIGDRLLGGHGERGRTD
jgi:hypothetical protein